MVRLLRNGVAGPLQALFACDPQLIRRRSSLARGDDLRIGLVLCHFIRLGAIGQGALGRLFRLCRQGSGLEGCEGAARGPSRWPCRPRKR
jgi:hypothetical protein